MNLRELQSEFEKAMRGEPSRAQDEIIPAGRLTTEEALGAYASSIAARLISALGETYETVWRALGDDDFLELAHAYTALHPSSTHSLQFYGLSFPEFIQDRVPVFVFELACFERLFADLFHRREEEGLDRPGLVRAVEENRPVRLVHASALFEAANAVHDLFAQRTSENLPDDFERPAHLLLYKRSHRIHIEETSEKSSRLLAALAAGAALRDALEASDALESEIAALFALLSEHSLLAPADEPRI